MCGVFGIRSAERDVARLSYFGLFALQHRGQEAAGIAVSDRGRLTVLRDMGLVAQVFDEEKLQALPGDVAIGHTRYSTTGSNAWANAQPLVHHGRSRTVAIGHNGNLTNTTELRDGLAADGIALGATSDTEVIAALIANDPAPIAEAVARAMPRLEGAYSVVALSEGKLLAFRDPQGIRPLALGRLGDDWVVASETCAFDLIGAVYEREVRPGELVVIDEEGLHATQVVPEGRQALCIFEHVYFARPDSTLAGAEVHGVRVRMGERLAQEAPVEADLVMPIPDSGTPAAVGFTRASGIPYSEGLIKNRYVGRTFIQPDEDLRRQGIRMKFNPLAEVDGKRLVIVDDSIVRGSTMQQLVADALRRRCGRGARARLVAADRRAVLLRDRHGRRGAARGRAPLRRADARADRRDLAPLPLARGDAGGDAAAGAVGLPRLLHPRLPDPRAGGAQPGQAPLRAGSALASANTVASADPDTAQLVRAAGVARPSTVVVAPRKPARRTAATTSRRTSSGVAEEVDRDAEPSRDLDARAGHLVLQLRVAEGTEIGVVKVCAPSSQPAAMRRRTSLVREAARLEIAELQVQDGPPAAPREDRQRVRPDAGVSVVEADHHRPRRQSGACVPVPPHVGERDRFVTLVGEPFDLTANSAGET